LILPASRSSYMIGSRWMGRLDSWARSCRYRRRVSGRTSFRTARGRTGSGVTGQTSCLLQARDVRDVPESLPAVQLSSTSTAAQLFPTTTCPGRRLSSLASWNIELILLSKQARPHLPNPLLEAVSQSEHSVTLTPSRIPVADEFMGLRVLIPHAVLDEEASEEEQL